MPLPDHGESHPVALWADLAQAAMTMPRVGRRWVALVVVVLIAVGAFRLLDQPLALDSYRIVDPQTLDVLAYGARIQWTHITGLTETDSAVTITVNSFVFEPGAVTEEADAIHILVHLGALLGSRAVIDGGTGQPIAETG